jgi:competence protein ComEC
VGRGILAPALTDNALPRLPLVVNSHPDTDHLAGLLFLLAHFRIGEYYGNGDSPAPELAARERDALAASGLRKKSLKAGDCLALAPELRLEVLWPPGPLPAQGDGTAARTGPGPADGNAIPLRAKAPEERSRSNDASLVMRLLWRNRPLALLCGDAGSAPLGVLAATRGPDLAARVLLLPHHGSASGLEPKLYAAVNPRLALVSCGYVNRYGFPAAAVRRELSQRGIPLYSTADAGQISVLWTDPDAPGALDFARP